MKTIRILFSWSIILTTALFLAITACQKTAEDEATLNTKNSELKKAPASDKRPYVNTTELYGNNTGYSIIAGGTVSLAGGAPPITECGVVWGTFHRPRLDSIGKPGYGGMVSYPPGIGTFTLTIGGTQDGLLENLTENAVYFITAYATNSNGTEYGVDEIVSITSGSHFSGTCPSTITIEGQIYDVVEIGDQCWMAENLNIGEMVTGGTDTDGMSGIQKYCYNNQQANCDIYGGLYQWDEIMCTDSPSAFNPSGVQGICPSGWHIPSFSEIGQLTEEIGGTDDGGGKLKETGTQHWKGKNVGATNEFGFTSLGSGRYWTGSNSFSNLKITTEYWTTTKFVYVYYPDESYAWSMGHIHSFAWNSYHYTLTENLSHSVRCLKD